MWRKVLRIAIYVAPLAVMFLPVNPPPWLILPWPIKPWIIPPKP